MLSVGYVVVIMLASPSVEVPLSPAEQLFSDGRAAFKKADYVKACELFSKSHEMQPALGVLLNLATCLEKQGKAGSAWLRFNEATTWAQRTHEGEREKFAREHAIALKPRVSWLSISASREVEVLIDGGAPLMVSSSRPTSVPVDIGLRLVDVRAEDFESWSATAKIDREGATAFVAVPELKSTLPPPPLPELKVDTGLPPSAPPLVKEQQGQLSQSGLAVLIAGGVVALGGGIGLAWSATTYQGLQKQRQDVADPEIQVSSETLRQLTWIYPTSWVLVGVGAAAVISGSILMVRGGSTPTVAPVIHSQGGGVVLTGKF